MKVIGFINPDTSVGQALPEYPSVHGGVVFVVGTAPCWEEDVAAARKIFPNADICAVNEAVKLIKADHVATSHDGRITKFMSQNVERWGGDYVPEYHFRSPQHRDTRPDAYSWDVTVGAGSAPFAAAVMTLIGYDLVVFCGCPMDGGGGYAAEVEAKTHKSTLDDPRFGFVKGDHGLVQTWKVALRNMPRLVPDLTKRWRSMSGYTKTIFGGP